MTKSFTKKLFFLAISSLMALNVWGDATPSDELFATYQKHGDRFYKTSGAEATLSEDYYDWNVNYYIVACGDSMLLRATTTEERGFDMAAAWQTQLRVWTEGFIGAKPEVQTDLGDKNEKYSSKGYPISALSGDDLLVHFFLSWEGNCVTQTFDFNRASINNPIDDEEAPVINPSVIDTATVGDNLVFTFGEVTADDEYFYYVGDKDHNLGGISLSNKVYVPKPTLQDGTTYKFKCYAVDYNGNKSEYKEFSLTMPFNSSVDLARGKSCEASATQGANSADRAVNGNAENFWTSFDELEPEGGYWWKVDLGNAYDVTEIKINFNDCWGTYSIYSSLDNANWTAVVENEPSATKQTKDYTSLNFAGRYLKVVSSVSQIGIKEFEVYASGLASADETDPEVTVTEIAKTYNTVTLQIDATDEDDAGNPGTITAINISGDNGFVTQNSVTLDGSNQITLSDLTENTTYHFTVTVYDLAGRSASETVEVVLPYDEDLDIALGRGDYCEASATQGTNTADKAVNGNANDFWTSFLQEEPETGYWWSIDLGKSYEISSITIHFNDIWGTYSIYRSADKETWTEILTNEEYNATSTNDVTKNHTDLDVSARYLKVTCTVQQIGIREFKVYASGFTPITLSETSNSSLISDYDNTCLDVTLSRSFAASGNWYTLCLPFDMTNAQLVESFGAGYTLATMTGSEDRGSLIHLNFDYVNELVAGKPYLFKPGTTTNTPTISGVTIKNVDPSQTPQKVESTYMNFEGTFDATTLTEDNQRFVGANNYLYSPRDNGTPVNAFRCFFTIPTASPVQGRRARIVFNGEEEATGVDNVQSDEVQCVKVISNGQLLIIRDGRTYNAQGQMLQ